ncbi:DUF6134 family protein [Mesonia aestuariivivens]|uniref:Uncharacterized protein n=1 Tax=Mesonia aestuariivivens TaxID=2796128 RepID=A0ABS6W2K4_9FLAO|nr:DUF6134 family protein [Mesonia aestuariivivens]MBW2962080.1 hypothetical protein [Mesonia aestuariivivens]
MKRLVIIVYLLSTISFAVCAQAEQNVFNILHKGKDIGTLYAKKENVGGKTIYSNRTEIDTRMITKIEVDYNYKVVYENELLSHAHVLILFNGKEKTNTYTDHNKTGYIFYEDDKEENRIHENIRYSTVNLMFEEPDGIEKVYAEEHGIFHQIKKIGVHQYEKTNHKGKSSIYTYKDGHLTEAEIDAGLISFRIIMK